MSAVFTDSIQENLVLLEELVRGLPPGARFQAKQAADLIENTFNRIQRDSQGNVGAAIGTAWAIYKLSEQLVRKSDGDDKGRKLIELVN